MTDVVLFDFFGTLVRYQSDRAALSYPRSHRLVSEWGVPLSHDDFVREWDLASHAVEARTAASHEELRMIDYAAAFGDRCEQDFTDAQCELLAATFATEWSEHVRPIEGAAELLVELADSFRLGIVSNTNDTEMVPRLVQRHFAADLVDCVLLSVEHGHRKPHPSIYSAVLAAFGCDAGDAVFVGDSYEADYIGPRAAGMEAFLIDPARRHPIPAESRLDTILDLPMRLS